MKIKPKQLREVIDIIRRRMLTVDHVMEHYEANIDSHPAATYLGRERMLQDLERLRGRNRVVRDSLRHKLQKLEAVLKEDEMINGWKGEDRYME